MYNFLTLNKEIETKYNGYRFSAGWMLSDGPLARDSVAAFCLQIECRWAKETTLLRGVEQQ